MSATRRLEDQIAVVAGGALGIGGGSSRRLAAGVPTSSSSTSTGMPRRTDRR